MTKAPHNTAAAPDPRSGSGPRFNLGLLAFAAALLFSAADPALAASSTIDCTADGYQLTCVVTAGNTTTDVYPTWCRSDFRGAYTCDGSTEDTEWGYFDSATCSGSGTVDGCSGAYCGCTGLSLDDTATMVVDLPTDNAPDEYFAIFTDWDAVNILSADIQLPVTAGTDTTLGDLGTTLIGVLKGLGPFLVLGTFLLAARKRRAPSL